MKKSNKPGPRTPYPLDKSPKICIIGPGAVGGVVAAMLSRKGYGVQLVTKYADLAGKISRHGP